MEDIEFVIVNSRRAHLLRSRLENRVTFEVFQDSEEADVWNTMDGRKDDIYVYDRCGRLAYFIPYPLSVMITADGLVPSAILATYFRSPCGATCEGNATSFNSTDVRNITQLDEVTSTPKVENQENSSNNTYIDNNQNTSGIASQTNNIYNIFSPADYYKDEDSDPSNSINHLSLTTVATNDEVTNSEHTISEQEFIETRVSRTRKSSERCKEADAKVCKDFTKRRLLRIQTCCSPASNNEGIECQWFTRKKCKKMKAILKCCMKTTFTSEIPTELETTTPSTGMICCKDIPEKVCRLSQTVICEDDEYEDVAPSTNDVPTEASM